MAFKSKAELQFEDKFTRAFANRDFELVEKVLNQFGCYLDLLEPLPESYGLPKKLCYEHEESDGTHEGHTFEDGDEVLHWCGFPPPSTAGEIAEGFNSYEAIMARVNDATKKALEH